MISRKYAENLALKNRSADQRKSVGNWVRSDLLMLRSYAQDFFKCIKSGYFLKQLGADDFAEMISSWRLSKASGLEVPHH